MRVCRKWRRLRDSAALLLLLPFSRILGGAKITNVYKFPRFRRMLMISRITRDVLESYLFCRYKGYLKWIGHQGIKSDYEILLANARDEVRLTVIEKTLTQYRQDKEPRGIPCNGPVKLDTKLLFESVSHNDR